MRDHLHHNVLRVLAVGPDPDRISAWPAGGQDCSIIRAHDEGVARGIS